MTLELRPYQVAADQAITRELETPGRRSTLLVMCTGGGKTVSFLHLAQRVRSSGDRTLILAHRDELIQQPRRKLEALGIVPDVEKGKQRASLNARIVIASVQSLRGARLQRFARDHFKLIIVDEAHHAPAPGYRTILDYFIDAQVLGVTATPDRADGQALGEIFESVAYRYEIRQAIRDEWLVPILARRVVVDSVDLSQVATRAGDLAQDQLAEVMETERAIRGVVMPLLELAGTRPTVVFGVDVEHARLIAQGLCDERAGCARWISGETDQGDRERLLEGFAAGEYQFLVNCALLTEGWDCPSCSCVAMVRPTKSRALYVQCLDAETEVLTPGGWRGIDDEIDVAAAFDLIAGGVKWAAAERVERVLGSEPMFGISNPHVDIRVTAGHRMVVSSRHGRAHTWSPWRLAAADALPQSFRIPLAGMDEPATEAPLTDHEVAFLGYLLSDGTYNPCNNAISLMQSERNPDVMARMEATIAGCGFRAGHVVRVGATNFGERSPLHIWTVSHGMPRRKAERHLTGWANLGPYVSRVNKRLTPEFEKLSARQVRLLVAALNDGNGTKHRDVDYIPHTWKITIANTMLGAQIQSLCVRRGLRCNLAPQGMCCTLHISDDLTWSVTAASGDGRPVWRQVVSDPEERVWCVTVDTGAIVTRRNGKVSVVGNCAGRGTRLLGATLAESIAAGKRDLLLLDFTGQAGRHRLAGPVDCLAGSDQGMDTFGDDLRAELDALLGTQQLDLETALDRADTAAAARLAALAIDAIVSFHAEQIDPFLGAPPRAAAPQIDLGWAGKPPSEAQVKALDAAGVTLTKLPPSFSMADATRLLIRLKARREAGLCSLAQAKRLHAAGIRGTAQISFDRAKALLTALREAGWHRPWAIWGEPEARTEASLAAIAAIRERSAQKRAAARLGMTPVQRAMARRRGDDLGPAAEDYAEPLDHEALP